MKQLAFPLTATNLSQMVISLFRAFWQQLKANLFEQAGTALLTSSDLLQAVITDLLFPVFNRIDQGRLISLLQACKRQYATGLFQQVCYSLTKWTGLLLYVNSLRQLGKINSWQQVCDISGSVHINLKTYNGFSKITGNNYAVLIESEYKDLFVYITYELLSYPLYNSTRSASLQP